MAEKTLELTFVRTINNRTGDYANRKWLGCDYRNKYYYGYCLKTTFPSGLLTSLKTEVKVLDKYSGIKNQYWTATYGVKISLEDINTYDSGIIPDEEADGFLDLKIWGGSGSGAVASGIISSEKLADYSGKEIYIYIGTLQSNVEAQSYSAVQLYPDDSKEFDLSKSTTITADYLPYTPVISPTILNSSAIVSPDGSLTIEWEGQANGVNVNIANFALIIKKSSSSGATLYSTTEIAPDVNSFTIKISDFFIQPIRGDLILASIQAIGDVDGFDGTINFVQIAIINSLPTAPLVSKSGSVIDASTNITFNLTKGTDIDSSQELSIRYKIGNDGDLKIISSSSLTLTIDDGLDGGTNTIFFYTYDGLENSIAFSTDFVVNYVPEFSKVEIEYTKVSNGLNLEVNLATVAKIAYELVREVNNPVFHFKIRTSATEAELSNAEIFESVLDSSNYTVNEITRIITISIVDLDSSIIPYGNYFQLAVQISDDVASSEWTDFLPPGLRPGIIQPVFFDSLKNDEVYTDATFENYFKNSVSIKLINPLAQSYLPKISQVQVIATHSNGTVIAKGESEEGKEYSINVILNSVSQNDIVSFEIKIVDIAGQQNTTIIPNQMTKTSELLFVNDKSDISTHQIKPFSNTESFSLSHSLAKATGTYEEKMQYLYKIQMNGTQKILLPEEISIIGEQRNIIISSTTINDLLKSMVLNLNSVYSADIIITAVDGFGTTKERYVTLTIDFIEPPSFLENVAFKLKHDFDIGNDTVTAVTGQVVDFSSINNSTRMFNPGEGIIFCLPKSTDPNQDIKDYQIFLSRLDVTDDELESDYSNFSFGSTPWLTLTKNQLESGASDLLYYYYRYKASQYVKNEYLYFKIRVRDTKGNISEELTSPGYVMGCRVAAPTFTVDNITATLEGQDLSINYNFNITDFGGSAKASGWTEEFYNKYPNLERLIVDYSPLISLDIKVSLDQTFNSGWTFSQSGSTPLLNFNSSNIVIKNFGDFHGKVFICFTLTIRYGINSLNLKKYAQVSSVPQTYTYFGTVPTVSHRKHHVGINTATFTEEDILVVENYDNRRYIVFKGYNQENNSTYIIQFDSTNGQISGILVDEFGQSQPYLKLESAIISGGIWD